MNSQLINKCIEKMIVFYNGSIHDIDHFLKVWAYSRMIGIEENLNQETQEILELSAIVHDIACPICREKYGNTVGKNQEKESESLLLEFFKDMNITDSMLSRIIYLVTHHHTYKDIDNIDYQILVEADFLVNASESQYTNQQINSFKKNVFKTNTGIRLLEEIYIIDN